MMQTIRIKDLGLVSPFFITSKLEVGQRFVI
jgi:hypothetical protein